MSGQVQATEVPHQVPEDDGMLAEELVGVDHLDGQREVGLREKQEPLDQESCVEESSTAIQYLIALVLQQSLQLLAQHQGAEVRHGHRPGVGPFGSHAILTITFTLISLYHNN